MIIDRRKTLTFVFGILLISLLLCGILPVIQVHAEDVQVQYGSFLVTTNYTDGVTYNSSDGLLQLKPNHTYTIKTTEQIAQRIEIVKDSNSNNGAGTTTNITFDGVNLYNVLNKACFKIPNSFRGNVNLYLKGDNVLHMDPNSTSNSAALEKTGMKDDIGTLKIMNAPGFQGTLTATAAGNGAAIGCYGDGNNLGTRRIIIESGTITANGGGNAAAIGGGFKATARDITINGGTITATPGYRGAGIGGGDSGEARDITINGGTIVVNAAEGGAGIGSGRYKAAENITITGGDIKVIAAAHYSTGIGSGSHASVNNINISGGIIDVSGGNYGAGIGSGLYGHADGITISGGNIKVKGGYLAAAIGGGGNGGNGRNIHISGGYIDATLTTPTYKSAAVIGSGFDGEASGLIISGGTLILDSGWPTPGYGYEPAIAIGGFNPTTCDLTITGGSICLKGGGGFDAVTTDGNGNTPYITYVKVLDNNGVLQVNKPINTLNIAYGVNDVITDSQGYVYFYLPLETEITEATIDEGERVSGYIKTYDNERSIGYLGKPPLFITGGVQETDYYYYNGGRERAIYLAITGSGNYNISMSQPGEFTSDSIYICAGAAPTITIDSLMIDSTDSALKIDKMAGEVKLLLKGHSSFDGIYKFDLGSPAISKECGALSTSKLIIDTADDDEIGSIELQAGIWCAALGSGREADAGDITINGGIIEAYAGYGAAGIGGGYKGNVQNITINGGKINAVGNGAGSWSVDHAGAGIGSGACALYAKAIVINGGTIFSQGGENDYSAPDIGLGSTDNTASSVDNVVITGGSVKIPVGGSISSPINAAGTPLLFCAIKLNETPNALVESFNTSSEFYPTSDVVTDENGIFYPWLPASTSIYSAVSHERVYMPSSYENTTGSMNWDGNEINIIVLSIIADDGQDFLVTGTNDNYRYDYLGTLTFTGGGRFTISQKQSAPETRDNILIDTDEDITLIIQSLNINSANSSCIRFKDDYAGAATIIVMGENTLITNDDSGYPPILMRTASDFIDFAGSLTIKAIDATLENRLNLYAGRGAVALGSASLSDEWGYWALCNLKIESVDLTAISDGGYYYSDMPAIGSTSDLPYSYNVDAGNVNTRIASTEGLQFVLSHGLSADGADLVSHSPTATEYYFGIGSPYVNIDFQEKEAPIYSVEIITGSMEFEYTPQTWDPDTLTYIDGGWHPKSDGSNLVTLRNMGGQDVTVKCKFINFQGSGLSAVNGVLSETADGSKPITGSSIVLSRNSFKELYLIFNGVPTENLSQTVLGSLTFVLGGN